MDTLSQSAVREASQWSLERYAPSRASIWDTFVDTSRNGTFLLTRPYMDYHADRFEDCSLMAYKNGKLRAVLPANISGKTLHSHQGLTYGGWITPVSHFDANDMLALWHRFLPELRSMGIERLDYKPVPWFYSRIPAEEDMYALFRTGARLTECNLSSVIDMRSRRSFNTLQRRHLKRALASGATVEEDVETRVFWSLLNQCLRERHGASPVHSSGEMELLRSRFPENIRLYGVSLRGTLHAGVCIYDTGRVAHCQYICSSPEGRDDGLLSLLFHWLITERYADRDFFDFGTSNEDHGLVLNSGLISQKAALGGSGAVYSRWNVDISRGSGPQ